ncbi:MAG: Helicase associated domain protein [Oscillospiraceae bacterium]|nr:Helicase associated domain protein [Oscillospiraceae bacterium]
MAISLYPHNAEAYASALELLAETRKATIIHPTGTGKSFIGFKLCEDNPDAVVCWLSPSEYIFKTQLENLRAAADGYQPENIWFYTYAKLMLMTPEEISKIQPDYIILDEFHRCGAEMWGAGVQRLLRAYPEPPILGLSATNIRYLDNQRDMADELFGNNIASQMSLGEAIVRGILNPPKYVLSLFTYQNQLEKYQSRLQQAKSKAVRDKGEEYLEALRRALEKAEGLDEIFNKHISDRTGKYLVFCANAEHMRDMVTKVPEWFGKVDERPHVYTAYSADPDTDKAFASFKADASEHLKLLFCIDMLNEGVHVPDVSGVILLRPTVSPIIYKQQIGRALSAGKTRDAVIFDIVLNIENLYSIGAIEEEMQLATTYYRSLGLDSEIVNEHFKVIDEVRDCVELFAKLNETLTASWDLMYAEAKKYHTENGDLNVPKRYITASGYSLGNWLNNQRRVRAGKVVGTLTEEQVKLLDDLGMRWESASDQSWERFYTAARRYYERHGDLLINRLYETDEGLKLGRWLANQRNYRKSGIRNSYLTDERIQALDELGMQWDVLDYLFERNYAAAVEYHRAHGDLNVPTHYIDANGLRLGVWIANLRTHYRKNTLRLSEDQLLRLNELGMLWNGKFQSDWDSAYEEAARYQSEHGNINVPSKYKTSSGLALGAWIARQRDFWKAGRLSEERKQKLDALGMVWEKDPWGEKYALLEQYYQEHGDLKMPADYVVNGVWLSRWMYTQIGKLNGKGKPLTEEQKEYLAKIGLRPTAKPVSMPSEKVSHRQVQVPAESRVGA